MPVLTNDRNYRKQLGQNRNKGEFLDICATFRSQIKSLIHKTTEFESDDFNKDISVLQSSSDPEG